MIRARHGPSDLIIALILEIPTATISFRRARGGGLAMIIIPRAPFFVLPPTLLSSPGPHIAVRSLPRPWLRRLARAGSSVGRADGPPGLGLLLAVVPTDSQFSDP